MAFNGSGTFARLYSWVTDRQNGIKIRADRMDAEFDGIAAALSNCVTRDGQSPPTQNLPMGGKRITGLAAAVAGTDAVTKAYVDDNLGISNIGDYLTTARAPGSNWLKRDGGTYTQASYPALATLLGNTFGRFSGFSLISYGVSTDINAMAYGAGLFVAIGTGGVIRTSPTGAVWTARTSTITNELSRIAYANGMFVVTSFGGKILTSPDGITWTARTSGVTTDLFGMGFGNGKWVLVGASQVVLVSSDNGVNWSSRTISGLTATLYDVAYGNSRFVVTGQISGVGGVACTSIDGDTYTYTNTGYGGGHLSVTFGKGLFVAAAGNAVYLSKSGSGAWQSAPVPGSSSRVFFGLNNFFAVGPNFTASSLDGSTWDSHTAIIGAFNHGAVGPDFALAGGAGGVLAKSTYAYDTVTQFQVPNDNPTNGYIKAL